MKGRAEKGHDNAALEAAALREIGEKFAGIRKLYQGLKRTQETHVAIESIDFEEIPGGQTMVLRLLYPYHMIRFELADEQIAELVNRAQGKTAAGVQVATPEQAAAILGGHTETPGP